MWCRFVLVRAKRLGSHFLGHTVDSLLCGSTVGYPSDRLASCYFSYCTVLVRSRYTTVLRPTSVAVVVCTECIVAKR